MSKYPTPRFDPHLLIVHQGALGDFVVTFSILKAFRAVFDRIDGFCRSSFGRLATEIGVLDRHYPLESARFASLYTDHVDSDVRQIISSYSHILLFSFSRTLEQSIKNTIRSQIYRIAPWPGESNPVHVTEFISKQVLQCGILSSADCQKFRHDLFALDDIRKTIVPPGSTIILSPGAGSKKKRWGLQRFLVLAADLASHGFRPLVLLGPAEDDIEADLHQRSVAKPEVVKCGSFTELLSLLHSAKGYIGNDSGVSHLAAYMGLSVLVVFGPTDPGRWRPFGNNVCVVKPAVVSRGHYHIGDASRYEPAALERISPRQVFKSFQNTFLRAI
jgi:ADP-heptose:LPS heptosyltransferase